MKPRISTTWKFTAQEQGWRLGMFIDRSGYNWDSIFNLSYDYWLVRNELPNQLAFREYFFESALCHSHCVPSNMAIEYSPKYPLYLRNQLLTYWDLQIWPRIESVIPALEHELQTTFDKFNKGCGFLPDRSLFAKNMGSQISPYDDEALFQCDWEPFQDYKMDESMMFGDDFIHFE